MSAIATARPVDLRHTTAAAERSGHVLAAFDALEPAEGFTLVDRRFPGDVLTLLQRERRGLFEWSPLEEESGDWTVEVTRRDAAPGSLRGINEALEWDHDRLERREQAAFAALDAGDVPGAVAHFDVFARGLTRHIRFEESVLFPAFEERSGFPARMGPTAVMRAEHGEIRALLEAIAASLGANAPRARELRGELQFVLGEHNAKEEGILYPGAERLHTAEEADALVARIQAFE